MICLLIVLQPSGITDAENGGDVIEEHKDNSFPPTTSNLLKGNSSHPTDSYSLMGDAAIPDDTFGDSDDDEIFAQIDEGLFGDASTGHSQDFARVSLSSPPMPNPVPLRQGEGLPLSTSDAASTSYSSIIQQPVSLIPSQNQGSSNSTSIEDNTSTKSNPIEVGTKNPAPMSSTSSSRSSVDKSREAFFENWDNDGISSYEKRLSTMKRRFPGPAGLLPIIPIDQVKHLSDADHPISQHFTKIISSELILEKRQSESSSRPTIELISPERQIHRINKQPWRELIRVLQLNPKDPQGVLSLMNIRWVKRIACRLPSTTRIPFLALVVREAPKLIGNPKRSSSNHISKIGCSPSVKLMDPTGSIVAAMGSKFMVDFGHELVPGTAIAFHDVSTIFYFHEYGSQNVFF
jgi:hypothetical protein